MAAFAAEPFGAALGVSTRSAMSLLADALDLRHRCPLLWAKVESIQVAPWKARRVAAGPPGQTRPSTLAALCRRHHRVKTFAGWTYRGDDGTWTWTSPHGATYSVGPDGTRATGPPERDSPTTRSARYVPTC